MKEFCMEDVYRKQDKLRKKRDKILKQPLSQKPDWRVAVEVRYAKNDFENPMLEVYGQEFHKRQAIIHEQCIDFD